MFQQIGELVSHSAGNFSHFVVRKGFIGNARRLVRNAGDAAHLQPGMVGGNAFGHRGHADGIRSQGFESPDFGRVS